MDASTTASGNNRNNHPFPWLNLMATEPFYLLHFLAFFSYFAARSAASPNLAADHSHLLFRRVRFRIFYFILFFCDFFLKGIDLFGCRKYKLFLHFWCWQRLRYACNFSETMKKYIDLNDIRRKNRFLLLLSVSLRTLFDCSL